MSHTHSIALSPAEIARYTRQLPIIGKEGQALLKQARVLCIGAGGLGSPALLYLAAAGVGYLTIVDGDKVDISNLQRQIVFRESDVGLFKSLAAKQHLQQLNSSITIHAHTTTLHADNAKELVCQHDIIIDATDNFYSRYLINRTSRLLQKPLVSASALQSDTQISVFNYQQGPCYECLYPKPPDSHHTPNCATNGIVGPLVGIAGCLQANEVLKIILHQGKVLSGKLLQINQLSMRFTLLAYQKNPHCQPTQCSQLIAEVSNSLSVQELAERLPWDDEIYLVDVRQAEEKKQADIGGELIPLDQLPQHFSHLPKDKHIVFYCKAGIRSEHAARFLQQQGYCRVSNLRGGILAWLNEIDPR